MANQLHFETVDIGAYTGSTLEPKIFISANYGQITLKDVKITGNGAGTAVGLILTTATNVGTPVVSGTLAAFAGTIVYAQGVAFAATISDATVDPGTTGVWLAAKQASGTAPANTLLSITYLDGV